MSLSTLKALTDEAQALASGGVPRQHLTDREAEVARQLQICNACRYCEGFCAVFPAMTRRLAFGPADVHFMANLCHNCGACLHACQYAPPHEFAVNIPQAMAQVRHHTYTAFAWPPALGRLYRRNGLTVAVALVLSLCVLIGWMLFSQGRLWGLPPQGAGFYAVLPHNGMVALFAPVFLWAVLALGLGVRRFWRDITPATSGLPPPSSSSPPASVTRAPLTAAATAEATGHVLRLTHLGGGHGEGCNNDSDAFSLARRHAHHLTFYGFLLCFAATSVATVYHYVFGWAAPYALPSLPKVLGLLGGMSLSVGTAWLWRLRRQRHLLHGDAAQAPMDLAFIALLFATSATGLLLWWLGQTPAMPLLLALHLSCVLALFITLPYGKFAHGLFRTAALLRHAVEQRLPNRLGLGGD